MKIGLNFTPYIKGKVGGMGQYMTSLLCYFPIISPKDTFYVVCYPDIAKDLKKYKVKIIKIDHQISAEILSSVLVSTINKYRFDVWFSPLLVLDPLNSPVPSAFCIPDMQHRYYPNFFNDITLYWREKNYQLSANNAQVVITLSEYSRHDIIRCLDVAPDKVKAIHLDAPDYFQINTLHKSKIKLPKNYLFYPANTWPHKNHPRLLQAFSRIVNNFPEVKLLFSGYSYDALSDIKHLISKFKLKDHVSFLGYVKDSDMPFVFKNAIGLIFPSLFEGFGIPLVEAMKSKCPIVCSSSSSIPEIVGNAGLYFDPLSVSDISVKLNRFLSDNDLRQTLIQNGLLQGKKYSYENTARETLRILKSLKHLSSYKNINNKFLPKISIITPSYNQGKYINRTIKSVLDQNYPNLEYIVMDGGSTDNTVNILKKYSGKIIWESEKDKGQADAINKGLKIATGDIVAYLNSDDTYEPGTFLKVAHFFLKNPQEQFLYGQGKHIDEQDRYIEDYPNGQENYLFLHEQCKICQPAAFWKRDLIDDIGYFDSSLKYAMDYDYWIRISKKYNLNYIQDYFGNTRFYPTTKTSGQRLPFHWEIIRVQKKHYLTVHHNWIFALIHVELAKVNRQSLVQNIYFNLYLIFRSFYLYLAINHHLPPKIMFKYYFIWFKHLFSFILKKQYQKF
jgi:glycosyltransferase involved in cell wall biosynthesis